MTTIDCKQCGKPFQFTQAERDRYARNGFAPPKRCRDCRHARRKAAEAAEAKLVAGAGAGAGSALLAGAEPARAATSPREGKKSAPREGAREVPPPRAVPPAASDARASSSSDRLEPISEDFDALDEDGVLDLPDVPRSPRAPEPPPPDEDDEPHAPGARRDEAKPPSGRSSSDRRPKVEFDVVCSACGAPTRVPFKPTAKRPVYCAACFEYR